MPPSSVFNVAGRVIKATVAAPLVAGLRRPFRGAFAPATAVDLAAVVGLAERNDRRAHRAADPHENLRPHARTSTAARTEVAPPVRSQAPSPGQRPRATRGLRIPTPGPSSISRSPIDYEVTRPSASSWRCADSSGSRRSLTPDLAEALEVGDEALSAAPASATTLSRKPRKRERRRSRLARALPA